TPNLAELTSDGLHEIRYEIGNPDLIPQNAFEYDLSTHYHTRNLTFDVACFYNRLTHYIFISPTDDTTSAGDPVYRYMQSGARLYGAEAGLHFHPKPVEWLHLEITYAAVIGEKDDGGYLPFIPAGKLNAEVRVEKKKLGFMENLFLKVMPSFAFSQNRVATGEEPASGYSLISAGLGAQVKMGSQLISITFVASNILDTKYIDHLSTLKEVGYFNPGRNFSLNLQIPFAIKGSPVE
ncbi:MAG: TonB-dependent receptor, partial [Bacteroidetes bacterium]|nr:TonB-dependent receptor [Bacteroidota bacterium]